MERSRRWLVANGFKGVTMMTTTPPDVLTRLQAAWLTPSLPATDSADNNEAEADPATITYCGPHNDPAEWTYSADRYSGPGYRTVHCQACGSFIGYQPPQARGR